MVFVLFTIMKLRYMHMYPMTMGKGVGLGELYYELLKTKKGYTCIYI